jgi:hypothetical protein
VSAAEVLLELLEHGIEVDTVGERVRCRHTEGALSPGLAARVREHREEILALLADRDALRLAMATAIFDGEPLDRNRSSEPRQLDLLPHGGAR